MSPPPATAGEMTSLSFSVAAKIWIQRHWLQESWGREEEEIWVSIRKGAKKRKKTSRLTIKIRAQ